MSYFFKIYLCSSLPIKFLILIFLLRYSPNLGLGLPPWNSPFHFSFLDLRQSVGILGRVITSSQGLYFYTNTEKFTHINTKHPCPGWDSNPRSRLPTERRQCMPQTARLPWPAPIKLKQRNKYNLWYSALVYICCGGEVKELNQLVISWRVCISFCLIRFRQIKG
jgi:hypothetical protein